MEKAYIIIIRQINEIERSMDTACKIHLDLTGVKTRERIDDQLRFTKWLILKLDGDLNVFVDAQDLIREFNELNK